MEAGGGVGAGNLDQIIGLVCGTAGGEKGACIQTCRYNSSLGITNLYIVLTVCQTLSYAYMNSFHSHTS